MKTNLLLLIALSSITCTKTDINFGDDGTTGDPNVSYFNNYNVDLSTFKADSFITSGHSTFTVGYHIDTTFGTTKAGSFIQVGLPLANPVKDKNVSFDSLVVLIKPNLQYYGDTSLPFPLKVHRITERIQNEDVSNTNFYNPRTFTYDPVALTQVNVTVKPVKATTIRLRLPDALGQELLTKFRTNDIAIRDENDFVNYFKGLYLGTDTSLARALYYFIPESAGMIMRLYYKLNNTVSESKYFDFPYNATFQVNNIIYHPSGTPLAAFTPFKRQLKKSSLTANKVYLHSNIGTYIKINFSSILNIKIIAPYIKVLKAELVINPKPENHKYPYSLPNTLNLYTTDENNGLNEFAGTSTLQSDPLYGQDVGYKFDITQFITDIIAEGRFSQSALMLTGPLGISDSGIDRLVIHDQDVANVIQLKLYVLGL